MPTYKLKYFNSKGAAEGIRLMFAFKGVEYEDIRIESEQWPNEKANTPQGMMPVLEIDGKPYCQSGALARYVARELDMYGSNSIEALMIDELMDTLTDMTKGVAAIFGEQDQDKKAEAAKKIVKETFPKFIPFICKRLNENKNGFMVGNKLSLGDICVYRTCGILGDFFGGFLPDYDPFWGREELKKHTQMVESIPQISAWIKKRPQTNL